MGSKSSKATDKPLIIDPEQHTVAVLLAGLRGDIQARNELEVQNLQLRRDNQRMEHERLVEEGKRLSAERAEMAKLHSRLTWAVTLLVIVLLVGVLDLAGVDLQAAGEFLSGLRGLGK